MEEYHNNIELEEDQILNMPDEAFINIFSFVPVSRRLNAVGMVCQKFYDLLCELEKNSHSLELNYQQIYDDEIFDSIISSGRRFNDITINLKTYRVHGSLERVEAVMQKFGSRVVKFKLHSSIYNEEPSEISESQLITIFNCLPKVQEITLRNICVRQSFNIDEEDLKLHGLTKLAIDDCIFETPAILNKIPADVLQELVFTFLSNNVIFQRFFNQQSKIKKLEMFENDEITFDHLQLEHLKISSSIDFDAMINQQMKLKHLDFAHTFIDDSIFSASCNLKYLEVFRTAIEEVSISEFKNLKNLTHLKELKLELFCSLDYGHLLELSMMKCLPIEKLTLLVIARKIPEEILVQMSLNYRRLKHFEINNSSIKIITTILEHFPSLDSMLFDLTFCCDPGVLIINDDLRHENLKQLVVINIDGFYVENSSALLKLVNACPNLKRIMISQLSGISSDDFKHIIESHPHLTHLSLEFLNDFEFNEEIIVFLKSYAPKLVHLRFGGLSTYPTYSTLRILLDEIFPNITFNQNSSGYGEIIMKKRNITDWYLKLKLIF